MSLRRKLVERRALRRSPAGAIYTAWKTPISPNSIMSPPWPSDPSAAYSAPSEQRQMTNIYPDDEVTWPETTRQLAALFQITAAIEHFYNGDLECTITLAGAAEGVLPDAPEGASLFQHLKASSAKHARKLDINFVQNWLKHGRYNGYEIEEMRITPFLTAIALWRAITKFVAVYEKETPETEKFMVWSREIGYPARTIRKRNHPKLRVVAQAISDR